MNLEEIISRVQEDCDEQNKVLETSIIIINYCVIINACNYYNYVISLQYNYCIVSVIKASSRNAISNKTWQ